MIDPKQEADLLRSLAQTYMTMYESPARGKTGEKDSDEWVTPVAAAGGRAGVMTPARGAGANKRHMNNPKGDDARIKTAKEQQEADRKAAAKDKDYKESSKPSSSMEKAKEKANFTPHEGPMKVKKIKPARGPRR
jgi:hypothetical protein